MQDGESGVWWIASWRQIISGFRAEKSNELPMMKLQRGVSPDWIYHLLAPRIVWLESNGLKSEFSRIRDWAEEMVLGLSQTAPPWPHETIEEQQMELLKQEFSVCFIALKEDADFDWFHRIIDAERGGVKWREWCNLVLQKLNTISVGKVFEEEPTARMLIVETALEDLREAILDNQPSVALMALKTLGWPSPWSPEVLAKSETFSSFT